MPPKISNISGQEAIRALERLGFTRARQKGSHVVMKKTLLDGKEIGCVVPLKKRLAPGTARSIVHQAQITEEEFLDNI